MTRKKKECFICDIYLLGKFKISAWKILVGDKICMESIQQTIYFNVFDTHAYIGHKREKFWKQ